MALIQSASRTANWGNYNNIRATDFPRLRNRGGNYGIRHLKRNPYSVKITVT